MGEWGRGFRAHCGRASTAMRQRLDTARTQARQGFSDAGRLLSPFVAEGARVSTAARGRVANAYWYARQRSWDLAGRLAAFLAGHRRVSIAAVIGVLLALALAGTGAALLATTRSADVVGVNYTTRFVTVTGPSGTQTYEVTQTYETTVTQSGRKRTVVRTRVVKGPGGMTTLREAVAVPGPVQHMPGEIRTVAGPTKTVTVAGPGQTVTQIQVTTEIVTVTTEVPFPVTVTVTDG
jgi:hypothetical protein